MDRPLISILHPTARVVPSEACPRGWRASFDTWLSRADHPERIEYVLSVHESRVEAFDRESAQHDAWFQGIGFQFVTNHGRDNCVDNLNNAAKHSTGQLLVGTMDDYYPPEHWDTLISTAFYLEADAHGFPYSGLQPDEMILLCSSGATPERDRELMI